jgi:hypothetical protein
MSRNLLFFLYIFDIRLFVNSNGVTNDIIYILCVTIAS